MRLETDENPKARQGAAELPLIVSVRCEGINEGGGERSGGAIRAAKYHRSFREERRLAV